ncbi:GSCOCG00008156001-RA-CDS [Cotesia congregata]|nr:GSCOCG00008156001-RA-CDS [Cotesia congregata]
MCALVAGEPRCICRPGFSRMFLDRPCKPTYTYTLRVGLDRIGRESVKYDHPINDSSSASFRRYAGPTREALDRTLMQSDLRDIYRGLDIAGFYPHPPRVEFHLQLSDNTSETRLKDVLKKYLISSNYSLGGTEVFALRDFDSIDANDFDECSTEEGGPHHDCSPHAACFNLRGSYQCSCKEGWADLSENSAYPGRICSQAPLGCASCNYKGHCVTNSHGQEICECFPWHSGQRCQVNLKGKHCFDFYFNS